MKRVFRLKCPFCEEHILKVDRAQLKRLRVHRSRVQPRMKPGMVHLIVAEPVRSEPEYYVLRCDKTNRDFTYPKRKLDEFFKQG